MEKEILLFFNKTIANSFLDTFMVFFTKEGWILWFPIFLWIIFKYQTIKNYKFIVYLILSLILGFFISDWISLEIKSLIQRVRPCWTEYFRGVVGCTRSYSFPSNHATNAATGATILFLFLRGLKENGSVKINSNLIKILQIYTISLALLISISRVYLGVHWPTDVLGGIILGIIYGYVVFKAVTGLISFKRVFYFTLIVLSLFRIYFILHGPLDLTPDEAHYWEWSRRLDLSYYSKGPMIAYLIAISTWIFGDNSFGVRIFAVVCSFLSSIFVCKITKKFFDEKTGFLSGIIFQFMPIFTTFGVIFTIDSPFILFWIISIYIFLLALENQKKWWLLLGIVIGFGLLTKYTMAFFYLCMFVYLIKGKKFLLPTQFSTENHLKNPYIYFSILISIIVFLPVIIWNIQHDFVTLKHTAGQAHVFDGLKISLKYFLEFIGSQFVVVTPLIFILGLYFIIKPGRLNINLAVKWFLISFSMPVFLFFLVKSIQGKVQPNWAMTAYVPFVIVLSYALKEKFHKKLVLSSIIIAFIFMVANFALPYLNLPAKIDPTARFKGWKELAETVSEIRKELEKNSRVIIFSDKYQISSELAFYLKDKPKVYCIPFGRRMNQYDLWESINSELEYSATTNLNRKTINGIYIVYGKKNSPKPQVSAAFEKCEPEYFTAYKKNVKIKDYTIFKCYNFRGMILSKPESY